MKAMVRNRFGSPDVLELREIDKPTPKDHQVLIRVHAASVNPVDWHILRGEPLLIRLFGFGLLTPKHRIIGADMAGSVEAVGAAVTRFKVGDEVFGSAMGGFAEYACLRESALAHKAAAISFEQAASVPVAGLTALQGLRDHGKIQPGHHVLINGASGGVGTFAVQIAKSFGAEVTGVCSTRNVEMVRAIGADHICDYTKEDYTRSVNRYNLILDCAAYRPLHKSLHVLAPRGTYVLVGGSGARLFDSLLLKPWASMTGHRKIVSMLARINTEDLAYLNELLAAGKVVPVIDRQYPLSDVPEAIRYVEEGHARGKVVITVRQ